MQKRTISIAATAFLFWSSVFAAGDIANDTDSFSLEAQGILSLPALDSSTGRMAKAMAVYAATALKAGDNGRLDDKGFDGLFQALSLDPDSQELARMLLAELSKAGKLKGSIERFKGLALSHPESLNLAIVAADLLDEEGRRNEATPILGKALEPYIDGGKDASGMQEALQSASAKYILHLAAEGDFGRFDKFAGKAFELPSLSKSLQFLQAAMLGYSAAEKSASPGRNPLLLWLCPSDKELYRERFEECMDAFEKEAEGQHIKLRLYDTALDLLSDEGRGKAAMSIILSKLLDDPKDLDSLVYLATRYLEDGDPNNSERAWRLIFKLGGRIAPQYYLGFGDAARQAGDLKDAANAYEWCLLMDPENKEAAIQLAWTYFEMKQTRKALAKLDKLEPSPRQLYLKALCFGDMKSYKEAFECMLKAREAAGKDYSLMFNDRNFRLVAATFADKAKNQAAMEAELTPLIEADPKDAEILNFVGYSLADANLKLDLAEQYIRRALEIDPENPAVLDSMAWVLYKKGSYKEALEWIKKSFAANGGSATDAVIDDHAGDIYDALGDTKEAVKRWRQALLTYSDETDPQKIAAKIKAKGLEPDAVK